MYFEYLIVNTKSQPQIGEVNLLTASMEHAQSIINYQFHRHSLLREALQAPGGETIRGGERVVFDGNRRLALLGDEVIKVVLLDGWYTVLDERGNHRNNAKCQQD